MRVSLVFEGTPEELAQLTQELMNNPGLSPLVVQLESWIPEIPVRVEVISPDGYIAHEKLVSLGTSLGESVGFIKRVVNAFSRATETIGVRRFFNPGCGWNYNIEDIKAIDPYTQGIPDFGKKSIEIFTRIVKALSESGEPSLNYAQGLGKFPIEELDFLSQRTYWRLKYSGINTIGDLVSRADYELLQIPMFGKKSLEEVKEALAWQGLQLAERR